MTEEHIVCLQPCTGQHTDPGHAGLLCSEAADDAAAMQWYHKFHLQLQPLLLHLLLSILQLLSQQLHCSFPCRGCFLKKSDLKVLSIGLAVGLLQLCLCSLQGVLQLVVVCLLVL